MSSPGSRTAIKNSSSAGFVMSKKCFGSERIRSQCMPHGV